MKSRTVLLLAIGVVALFAVMFALNYGDREQTSAKADLLLPELKDNLNDIDTVTITAAEDSVTISNENGRWIVPDKGGYPADTASLRTLLLALADARKVEQKTSNPDMYEHLGVEDPAQDGEGVLVSATGSGDGFGPVAVILGDPAQGAYRYARIPEEAASWLIDRNPEVAATVAGWLLPDIVDIEAARVRTVDIRHADGETIRIEKESPEDSNFEVKDIPDDRELSYPSVANNIAGVLGNLRLDDVREAAAAGESQESVTVSFTTFDGLGLDLAVYRENSGNDNDDDADDGSAASWIALQASAVPATEGEPRSNAVDADVSAQQAGTDVPGASAAEDAADPGQGPPEGETGDETVPGDADSDEDTTAEELETAEEQADAINARVTGWQYKIPDYKARQLTRRWDDLLSERAE